MILLTGWVCQIKSPTVCFTNQIIFAKVLHNLLQFFLQIFFIFCLTSITNLDYDIIATCCEITVPFDSQDVKISQTREQVW